MNFEKSIDFISKQQDEFCVKIKTLEEECRRNRSEIAVLQEKMEDLQRVSKLTFIELRNVPYKPNESKKDLINYVLNCSNTLNVKLQASDIQDIYRLKGKRSSNTPIVTQLTQVHLKNSLISAVKDLNKTANKLNAGHAGLEGSTSPIYLAEHLTIHSRKLFYLARQLTKENKIKYCWTSDGKVLVKKADGTPTIYIKSETQLEELTREK